MNSMYMPTILLVLICSMICCSQTVQQVSDSDSGSNSSSNVIQNKVEIKVQEHLRNFLYYVPSKYNVNTKLPLVVVLHGGGGSAQKIQKVSGWDKKAEEHNFIVVYPNAIEKHWNDGRTLTNHESHKQNIDDVSFISETIDHVQTKFAIDEKRIYVTGMSNGAMMTFRVACEIPDKIAAVAPLIGSMAKDYIENAIPKKPIPILIMNGTKDPLMPWEGGDITFFKKKLGKVVSIAEVTNFWIINNNCFSLPETRKLPDTNTTDGSTVMYQRYHAKKNGKEVTLYTINGGGHTWPGGPQYLAQWVIGKTNRDTDAIEIVWDFFSKYSLD